MALKSSIQSDLNDFQKTLLVLVRPGTTQPAVGFSCPLDLLILEFLLFDYSKQTIQHRYLRNNFICPIIISLNSHKLHHTKK